MTVIIWAPIGPVGIIIKRKTGTKALQTKPLNLEFIAAHFESFASSFGLRALTGVAHV
jgi:hypothetical protein